MDICMLTSEFPQDLGGISTYVHNLSKRLIERGHNVTVVTRGKWNKSYYEEIDGISVYRVMFLPLYPYPFKIHGLLLNKLFKKIEKNFDVLHIHGFLIPVVNTSLPIIFTSHGTCNKDLDNMEIKSLYFLFVKLLQRQLFDMEKGIIDMSDYITSVSQSCSEELKECHAISKKIDVINNGVDTNFFIPTKNKLKGIYILYTGRLETRKGLIDLIESARYVCKSYPYIKFILTGKGTIKEYLERKVESFGLKNNFYFAGFVSRSELLNFYQNATVYVLPSYYEGLPTTLLEAMSCGIPSIATNVEGNFELVDNNETGLLVPSRRPDKLAEAIIRLIDDKDLRDRICTNARKHIEDNYDWNIITTRIENIYKHYI